MQQRRWMGLVVVVVAVVAMAVACGSAERGGGEGAASGEPLGEQASEQSGPAARAQAMPAALRAAYIAAVQARAPAAYEVHEQQERGVGLWAQNPAQQVEMGFTREGVRIWPVEGSEQGKRGWSLTVSGDTALVGKVRDDYIGLDSGSAYVFVRSGGAWSQQAKLLPAGVAPGGEFGVSVSVSGDTALVGAYGNDDNGSSSGSAYIFAFGLSPGDLCVLGTDCASGFCVDGVCCNTACAAGPCDACSVAAGAPVNGTCALWTGPPCDDGDLCTQTDTCQAGVCTGTTPVTCPPPDQCHNIGTCDSMTGVCSMPPNKPDNVACNDGNACTQQDTCQVGVCTGMNPVQCPPLNQCHHPGSCDP